MGSVGTNLLLLICGLFVAKSVAASHFRYVTFLVRRAIRVYPPYVLVICGTSAVAVLFPRLAKAGLDYMAWRTLGEQLLLWPGLFPNRPVLTVAWTLSWVMAAYTLLPLPLASLRRVVPATAERAGLLCGGAVALAVGGHATGTFSPRLSYILGGCAVYETIVFLSGRKGAKPRLRVVGLSALVFLALRFSIESSEGWNAIGLWRPILRTICGLAGISLLSLAVFLVQSRYDLPYDGFPLSCVRRLGRMGYSFYMLHAPVIKVFAALLFATAANSEPAKCWLLLPLVLLAAVTITGLMYTVAERPLQRLSARLR